MTAARGASARVARGASVVVVLWCTLPAQAAPGGPASAAPGLSMPTAPAQIASSCEILPASRPGDPCRDPGARPGTAPSVRRAVPCATTSPLPYRCPTWSARYEGPAGWDVAEEAVLSPGGDTVFVTGWSEEPYEGPPGYSYDFATAAYDAATGATRWVVRYNGAAGFFDVATAIAVSPDGSRVFVTGYSLDVTYDYVTIAYDAASGERLWLAAHRGPGAGTDVPYDVATSLDGSTVYVTGESHTGKETGGDAVTVAYDAATGIRRWVWRMVGVANYPDAGIAVVPAPDGSRVYTAARLGPEADLGYRVGAFATEPGEEPRELWQATYHGTGNHTDLPAALTVAGGLVIVTGEGHSTETGGDFLTIAYDGESGREAWRSRYAGSVWQDTAAAIGRSPDGRTVYVAGSSLKPGATNLTGDWDAVVVAYEVATGAQRWVSRVDGETRGDDYGAALAVAPDGSTVYLVGAAQNVPSAAYGIFYDFVTTALDADDGSTVWRGRYDSADQDVPSSLVVGAKRLHVTGTSFDVFSSYDFATVTYDA